MRLATIRHHRSGLLYTYLGEAQPKTPGLESVHVYTDKDGNLYARTAADFAEKFTPATSAPAREGSTC